MIASSFPFRTGAVRSRAAAIMPAATFRPSRMSVADGRSKTFFVWNTSMRVLLWEQHNRGVGHFMRMAAIASRLCERHEVSMFIGGYEPVFSRLPASVTKIQLPVLVPRAQAPGDHIEQEQYPSYYASGDGGDARAVLRQRRRVIEDWVLRFRPDVFVTEYFPLGRFLFGEELLPVIGELRARGARIVCSVREILQGNIREKLQEAGGGEHDTRRVQIHQQAIATLNAAFDHLLVHGDARFVPLGATVPRWLLKKISIPITYTGYVSEPLPQKHRSPKEIGELRDHGGFVIASVGAGGSGGRDRFVHGAAAITPAIEAWRTLAGCGRSGQRTMVIFTGVHDGEDDVRRLRRACADGPFLIHPATADFLSWLQVADLSISRAGYNTCTNILATGVPAILLPCRSLADQEARAHFFAERGIASVLGEDAVTPESLADAIVARLRVGRGAHQVSLDGAEVTAAVIESIR
jgi:predicted glycosyltransferase